MASSGKRVGQQADYAEKQRKALALKRAGASYDQIAQQLKLTDRSHARKVVIGAIQQIPREEAREVRAIELERLDAMLRGGLYDKACKGDVQAIDRVLKVMDRRAAYLGLDAPKQHRIGGQAGGAPIQVIDFKDLAEMTDEQLGEAIAAAAKVGAAADGSEAADDAAAGAGAPQASEAGEGGGGS